MKMRGRTENAECLCKTGFDAFSFVSKRMRGRERCIFFDHGEGVSMAMVV